MQVTQSEVNWVGMTARNVIYRRPNGRCSESRKEQTSVTVTNIKASRQLSCREEWWTPFLRSLPAGSTCIYIDPNITQTWFIKKNTRDDNWNIWIMQLSAFKPYGDTARRKDATRLILHGSSGFYLHVDVFQIVSRGILGSENIV
jgi:hypothetical protein